MNVSYVPFLRYLTPNNGMPLNYRMSHKRDVGRRSRLFIIHPHLTLPLWGTMGSHRNTAITFGVEKLEWWSYQMVKKSLRICLFVSIQYTNVTDRQTEIRTDGRATQDGTGRAMHVMPPRMNLWIELGGLGIWRRYGTCCFTLSTTCKRIVHDCR